MANCYVWLSIKPEGLPSVSSIMFIGKEELCIDWVRRATYHSAVRPKLMHELKGGFYFRNSPERIECRLTAGEGDTRIEKNFTINFKYL
jgi:hypothetical protein